MSGDKLRGCQVGLLSSVVVGQGCQVVFKCHLFAQQNCQVVVDCGCWDYETPSSPMM